MDSRMTKWTAIAIPVVLTVAILSVGQVRYRQEQSGGSVALGGDGQGVTDAATGAAGPASPDGTPAVDGAPAPGPDGTPTPGISPSGTQGSGGATPGKGTPGSTGAARGYPNFGLVTQGVTPTSVKIGLTFNVSGCGDAGTLEAAFGSAVTGDPERAVDAFTRYVNDTGGVGGRKLSVVIADDGSGGCPEKAQAAAVELVDQHKVFLAIPGIHEVSDYVASRKVPLYGGRDDPASMGRLAPNGLGQQAPLEPTMAAWASFGTHYLGTKATKACLLHPDAAEWNAYEKVIVAKAAEQGFAFADIVRYSGEVATAQQQANAAVLRMKRVGCTQVWYLAGNGIAAVFFTNAATNALYFPDVWTFTSYSALMDYELSGRLMDQQQWEKAIGLSARVPAGQHPAEGQCRDIYQHYYPNDGFQDSASVLILCSHMLNTVEFMRRGVARYGDLNADTFLLGADAVNDDFYVDAHVPTDWVVPGLGGPFRTKGQRHFTVVDWNSARSAYEFPDYPRYWETFGPGKSGATDLRSKWKQWRRLPLPR